MSRKKSYLLLPIFAVFAFSFGSVSFAQAVDREALKAELKQELKAELLEEIRTEMLSEAQASVQKATEEAKINFKEEIRSEIMEETSAGLKEQVMGWVEEAPVLSGLFKGVTVSGFVDTMFSYNLRQHGEATSENNGDIGGLNFIGENDDNTFTVNAFAFWLDKEATDEHAVGWQVHMYMGEIAKRITFIGEGAGAPGGTDDLARNDIFTLATANVTWNAPLGGYTVPITMGKMYTWIGYELVENIGNPNYSHGVVYNNVIPFTHMGLSFDVSEFLPSDKLGLTLYYVNGWDSFIDNNESKSYGGYLTYEPNDDFFISLAVINGNEGWNTRSGAKLTDPTGFDPTSRNNGGNTFMYDIVATYALPQVEKLSLGFNWDWGRIEDFVGHNGSGAVDADGDLIVEGLSSGQWWAAVGYAMYDFTDRQQGALRYEYFDDTDGARFFGHSIWTLTYTHNIKIQENLLLRPEIRYNKHNVPDSDELSVGDKGNTADSEFIFTIGAEYVF